MGSCLRYLFVILIITSAFLQTKGEEAKEFGNSPADISAKITGASAFCKDDPNAKITFEGEGGTPPYMFTYQIDGTTSTISTNSNSSTVQIPVVTTNVKTIIYKISKIKDSSLPDKDQDVSRTITINDLPKGDFIFTNNNSCSGTNIQFTATPIGKAPFTFTWNFGDNTTSTLQNPTHAFTALGCGTSTFKVVLTITDANGCSGTIIKDINVTQKPDIEFTDSKNPFNPFSNCGNASIANPNFLVEVKNISKSGCISSFSLDWGDGSPVVNNATFPIPHTYTKLGAFNLVITAKGTNGCENKITYIIKNVTNPSVGVTSPGTTTNLCAPTEELKFEIAKWGNNSPGTSYDIDYGDGSPIITLTQEDLIKSPYYNSVNPESSQNYPIPHSYKNSNCPQKEFIVTVTAYNVCSSTTGTVNNITVLTKPVADFEFISACLNSSTKFINKTIAGFNPNCSKTAEYTWDFGDGTAPVTTTNDNPNDVTHIYSAPGKYNVTLKTKNYCGESTVTKQITISPLPTGSIAGGATVCKDEPQPEITFTGLSGTAPFTFTYNINDGAHQTIKTTTGNSVNLKVPTANPGKFIYKLISVTDANSCSQPQSGNAIFEIKAKPTATITGPANTCQNAIYPKITFTGNGGTPPYTFTYNIDNGSNKTITTTSGNIATVDVPTENLGTFKYNLVGVTDGSVNACASNQTGSVTISVNQSPAPMTVIDYEYCNGVTTSPIIFSNTVANTTYTWTNSNTSIGLPASGNGNISSFVARNNTADAVSSTITVTPTSNGCTGSSVSFTIKVNPSASIIFSLGNQSICTGDNSQEVQLNSSTPGATLSWIATQPAGITGVVTSGTDKIPSQTLINTTNKPIDVFYKAKATVAGSATCPGAEYTYTITVNPKPEIKELFNISSCSNKAFIIAPSDGGVNSIPTGTTYTWAMPVVSPVGAIAGASEQKIPQSSISQTLVNTTSATATATYTVTPVFNGCTGNTFEIKVDVPPIAKVEKINDIFLCNNDKSPLIQFIGSPAGTVINWTSDNPAIGIPSSGTNSIASFTALNIGTSPANATITAVPKLNGCDGETMQFSITVNPTGQVNNPGAQNLCNGQIAAINFSTKNTGGTTTYSWTNDNSSIGLGSSGNGNISFTPINNGTTSVTANISVTPTYTNNGVSCLGTTEQFKLTVNPTPNVNQPENQTLCNGAFTKDVLFSGSITGSIFNWSNDNPSLGLPANGSGDIVSFLAKNNTLNPITATVTVTPSINGCPGQSKSFTITVNPAGILTKQPVSSDECLGDKPQQLSVTFTNGTGPPTYQWFSNKKDSYSGSTLIPGANQPNYDPPFSKADTTFYYCVITFPSGTCNTLTTDIARVAINALPVISVINTEINSGETFTVIPSSLNGNLIPAGTTYTWSEPVVNPEGSVTGASAQTVPQTSISQNLTSNALGTVTVTYNVTPVSGLCIGEKFQVIVKVQPPIYTTTKITPITCYGANNGMIEVFVDGGVAPYQIVWSNMGTGNIQKDLSPGIYTITITDAVGVQKTISETIDEANLFTINPVVKQITCFGANDGSIALNFEGGIPPITLNWADNSPAGSTRNNLAPGDYSVTIIDSKGCRIDETFTIIEPLPILISSIVTNSLGCSEQNKGAIDLTVSGGSPPYLFAWSNGSTTEDLINIPAGIYTIKVTDAIGCSNTGQYTVTRPGSIEIAVSSSYKHDCVTNIVTQVCTAIVKGGVPPHQIEWSSGIATGANNEMMETDQSGLVIVKVTDALGCEANYSFNTNIPTLGIEYQMLNCDQHSYGFNVVIGDETQKLTYKWDFGDGTTSVERNPSHNFRKDGSYVVTLTTTNATTSCVSNYNLPIQVEARPVVSLDKDPKLCEGDTLTLHAEGADSYRWNTGSTYDTEYFSKTGDYFIIGYSNSGCTDTVDFEVSFFTPRGYKIFSDRQEITNEENRVHFWTNDIPFSEYEWNFDDGVVANGPDNFHRFEQLRDGYFDVKLEVINPDGCIEKDAQKILVTIQSVANTFTPNGDGINDLYMVGWYKKIYNRNGILLFDGKDGWDGTYNGKQVANDTYFVIIYDSSESGSQYKTSYVTVIR